MSRTYRDRAKVEVFDLKQELRGRGFKVKVIKKGPHFIAEKGGLQVKDTDHDRLIKKCVKNFVVY